MNILTPLIFTTSLVAQFQSIGSPCNTYGFTCSNLQNPRPGTLVATGSNKIGNSYMVTSVNQNNGCHNGPSMSFILTGIETCDLPFGFLWCRLNVIPLVWNFGNSLTVNIPNQPWLNDLKLYHQAYIHFSDGFFPPSVVFASNGICVNVSK